MGESVRISREALQTKLHMDQAVAASVVGDVPAVFIILRKNTTAAPVGEVQIDALTAMSAERAREMAMALWNSAEAVDRLNAERKGGE